MFFRILRYDIRKGMLPDYKKFGITIAVSIAFCLQFLYRFGPNVEELQHKTFGDVIFFAFSGIPNYEFAQDKPLIFPALWILLFLMPMFFVIYYPFNDLLGFGKSILIQVKRRTWWISKCTWVIIYITTYFAVIYSVVVIFCLLMHIPLSSQISQDTYERAVKTSSSLILTSNTPEHLPVPEGFFIQLYVLPVLSAIAVALVQMTISLMTSPIYSFIVSVGIFLTSAYYMSPLLLGNYCMAIRSNVIIPEGVTAENGALLAVLVSSVSIILGMLIFDRSDILPKTLRDE